MRIIFALVLASCSTGIDYAAPPAVPNPTIKAAINGPSLQLCADSLSPEQYDAALLAVQRWSDALPELNLRAPARNCLLPYPVLKVDAERVPEGADGWTDPRGVYIRSDEVFSEGLVAHEFGHWLGLIRHCGPKEPSGVMCDRGNRAASPSEADVAILLRTYFGRVSAANILED